MKSFFIVVFAIVIFAVVVIMSLIWKKDKTTSDIVDGKAGLMIKGKGKLRRPESYEMVVQFDNLPALTEDEESRLVEVKDSKLLARIDSIVPGTLQVVANTGAVKKYAETAKSMGPLYQAIIPEGAVLDKSRAMEGAVRGSYREEASNSIKGQANWIAADNSTADNLAALNVANAVMGVAAMVVGQYYMTQINDQLKNITVEIEKIADFQEKEFKSKVYELVAETQKSSTFQVETMENNELRNRELTHLKSLEHECAQLLGQANLSLQEIAGKKNLDYAEYEKLIGKAETWSQYQHILLEVMYKISDLSYALNLGAISRENSYALYLPYAKQSEDALEKLMDWHKGNTAKLEINVDESRRRRQGVEGFLMKALSFFDDNLNYRKISGRTKELIELQAERKVLALPTAGDDYFQDDVRLVAKKGKLFYLPNSEEKCNCKSDY